MKRLMFSGKLRHPSPEGQSPLETRSQCSLFGVLNCHFSSSPLKMPPFLCLACGTPLQPFKFKSSLPTSGYKKLSLIGGLTMCYQP